MFAVFRNAVGSSRGSIIGWGLALFFIGVLIIPFYDTIAENAEQFTELFQAYPPEVIAFFGDITTIATPEGYLSTEYFSFMSLVLGIYALLAGSGLLVGDEEGGMLDLLMAYPVSRTAMFLGRFLAFVFVTAIILLIGWLGLYLPASRSGLGIAALDMLLAFVSLFALLTFFGAFSLMLSMLLPSRRLAAMVSGIILVLSFFVTGLARLDENLEAVAEFSPLNYYQGGGALSEMDWASAGGLIGVALLFALIGWWRFERRDIRVAGEGGWTLPLLGRRAARRPAAEPAPTGSD